MFALDGSEDEPGYFWGVGGGGQLSRGSISRILDYRGSRGIQQESTSTSNLPGGATPATTMAGSKDAQIS